jgi:hypothetical protein
MRGSICGVLALVAIAGLALPVFGQNAAPTPRSPKHPQVPYTAEYRDTIVRTLANGTTITLESSMVMANDSQGRTMSSTTELSGYEGGEQITRVIVTNPVAGTHTSWTSPGTRATVTSLPKYQSDQSDCYVFFTTPTDSTLDVPKDSETTEPARGVVGKLASVVMKSSSDPAATRANLAKPVFTTVVEDLGTATIQGVEAHGIQITRTTPAGAAGNDQPLVNTEENWRGKSQNPDLLVRHVSDDPQFGKSTKELVSLNLSEPDPSLFQPPEGYEIVTQEMHSAPCPKALKTPQQ